MSDEIYILGTVSPPYGTGPNSDAKSGFPGVPDWLDLNMIVPVSATVIVVCVGILVVCVAMSRRKAPPLMNPGYISAIGILVPESGVVYSGTQKGIESL